MQPPEDTNPNPYQSPAETQDDSSQHSSTAQRHLSQHVSAITVIGFVSLVVAMFVTPADPLSMLIMAVPIFVLAFTAYLFGFRNGKNS